MRRCDAMRCDAPLSRPLPVWSQIRVEEGKGGVGGGNRCLRKGWSFCRGKRERKERCGLEASDMVVQLWCGGFGQSTQRTQRRMKRSTLSARAMVCVTWMRRTNTQTTPKALTTRHVEHVEGYDKVLGIRPRQRCNPMLACLSRQWCISGTRSLFLLPSRSLSLFLTLRLSSIALQPLSYPHWISNAPYGKGEGTGGLGIRCL